MKSITIPVMSIADLEDLAADNDTSLEQEIARYMSEIADAGESHGVRVEESFEDDHADRLFVTVSYSDIEDLKTWMADCDPNLGDEDIEDIISDAEASA